MALHCQSGKGNFDADKFSLLVGLFGFGVLGRVSGGFSGGWVFLVGWLVFVWLFCLFFFFPALAFRTKMSKLLGAVLEAGNRYSLIYF